MNYTEQDVRDHMGLVHTVVKKYTKTLCGAVDYDDLLQDGQEGLLKALHQFDPDKGFQFSSFAWSCIRNAILTNNRRMFSERWRANRRGAIHLEPLSLHGFGAGGSMEEDSSYREEVLTSDHGAAAKGMLQDVEVTLSLPKIIAGGSKGDRRIAKAILAHPDLRQSEVAELLGLTRQRVSMVWKTLLREGRERLEQQAGYRQLRYGKVA